MELVDYRQITFGVLGYQPELNIEVLESKKIRHPGEIEYGEFVNEYDP
jgi:hypothetical protein